MKLHFSMAALLVCMAVLAVVCALAVCLKVHEPEVPMGVFSISGTRVEELVKPANDRFPTASEIAKRLALCGPLSLAAALGVLWAIRRLNSWRYGTQRGEPRMTVLKPKRRFRFSLRTLLVLVALAGVGSWAYWIGWPRWRLYRQESEFESNIVKFHAGISELEMSAIEPMAPRGVILVGSTWYDNPGVAEIAKRPPANFRIDGGSGADDAVSGYRFWTAYEWPNGTYVIWWRWARSESNDWRPSCTEFAAHWLPIPPVSYRPATSRAQKELRKLGGEITPEILARFANMYDLIEMTAIGHSIAPGFKFKLIYSDPPTKPVN